MNDIKVGDEVALKGVVTYVGDGLKFMDIQIQGHEYDQAFPVEAVTFISRPEPTYTVELTASELKALRSELGGLAGSDDYNSPSETGYRKIRELAVGIQ